MAGYALCRRWLIKDHGSLIDRLRQFVATRAAYVAMSALQRKRGLFVVVQQRGFPCGCAMTAGALCDSALGKLPAVDIGVAGFAS